MKKTAILLVLVLVISVFSPTPTAFAAGGADVWDGTVDVSWYDPSETEYYISTPAQLAGLAALVNGLVDADTTDDMIKGEKSLIKTTAFENQMLVGAGGGNVFDTLYVSATDFAYKTVYLCADLDMGGSYNASTGAWSGPNWTPIGGRYAMDIEGTTGDVHVIEAWFNGVFDGQGHTISNIYCNRYTQKGFPYSQGIGLFGYVGGQDELDQVSCEFENGWQPSVRNLVLGDGLIYGRRMVGGIIGCSGDASNGVLIECCANYATVKSTDSKGVGGIIGCGWSKGAIRYCYNSGDISTVFQAPAGGICASNDGMDIYNCYNVGTIATSGFIEGRGIGGHDTGAYEVVNCLYLAGCDDDPSSGGWYTGSSTKISVDVKSKTSAEMKTQAFVDTLNANGKAFVLDSTGKNGGYPVLWFEAGKSGSFDISCAAAKGGTVSGNESGSVPYGTMLRLSSNADAGYSLKYFTVNGQKIYSDFYLVDGAAEISGYFAEIKQSKISIPQNDACSVTVLRTGYKLVEGEMVWVANELLHDGDGILEENVITVKTYPYDNVCPADMDLEYTDSVSVAATNATSVTAKVFTVNGGADVEISATRGTRFKQWTTMADTSWYTGSQKSYTLTTAEQLAGLAQLVNSEGVSFKGVTVTLGNDISLKNTDGTVGTRLWKAVGTSVNKSFKGTFDGQGFEITDMTVGSTGSYAALFGYCSNATVKNVTVRGDVRGYASASYAAGIAACASGTTIENCVSYAEVTASGTYAAGIAAYISDGSTVTGCVNVGKVSGLSGVGGIVGVAYSGSDKLSDCVNYGSATSTGESTYGAGGIVGKSAGTIEKCRNYADVSGSDRYMGGIAGYTSGKGTSILSGCYNAGNITATASGVTASTGGVVGYAQFLTMKDCTVSGLVSGKAQNTGSIIGRLGNSASEDGASVIKAAESVYSETFTPTEPAQGEKRTSFTATFVADGSIVSAVEFTLGQSSIKEPAVPAKEGCFGYWRSYALGEQDIVVEAVYRPVTVSGGETISKAGTYYLDYYATGCVTIADGLAVTLDGSLAQHDGLSIEAGKNVSLTLLGVSLSSEETILTMQSGALVLEGANVISGRGENEDNANAPVKFMGDATVSGAGSLTVSSLIRNCAIFVAEGSVFEQKGGTLIVTKDALMGSEGGALWAWGASVKFSGGTFSGFTNSDNVSVISAESVSISGGTVTAVASKARTAIDALSVSITGGSVKVLGHTGNADESRDGADNSRWFYNADAINDYNGKTTLSCSLDGNTAPLVLQTGRTLFPKTVLVDGKSCNIGLAHKTVTDIATAALSTEDAYIYLYLTKGDHTLSVDGTEFSVKWNGTGFDILPGGLALVTVRISDNSATVSLPAAGSAVFEAASFAAGGKQTDYASAASGSISLASEESIFTVKTFALQNGTQIFDKFICQINF